MIDSKDPKYQADYMCAMQERSGAVDSQDALVSFLYILIRDHLPAGVVEEIMLHQVTGMEDSHFTNGWLANYAIDLAKRLK